MSPNTDTLAIDTMTTQADTAPQTDHFAASGVFVVRNTEAVKVYFVDFPGQHVTYVTDDGLDFAAYVAHHIVDSPDVRRLEVRSGYLTRAEYDALPNHIEHED